MPFSFTDCEYDYKNNNSLYAMLLPLSCKVVSLNPRSSMEFAILKHNVYQETDLKYSLTLTNGSQVIIMYQFAGKSSDNNSTLLL